MCFELLDEVERWEAASGGLGRERQNCRRTNCWGMPPTNAGANVHQRTAKVRRQWRPPHLSYVRWRGSNKKRHVTTLAQQNDTDDHELVSDLRVEWR